MVNKHGQQQAQRTAQLNLRIASTTRQAWLDGPTHPCSTGCLQAERARRGGRRPPVTCCRSSAAGRTWRGGTVALQCWEGKGRAAWVECSVSGCLSTPLGSKAAASTAAAAQAAALQPWCPAKAAATLAATPAVTPWQMPVWYPESYVWQRPAEPAPGRRTRGVAHEHKALVARVQHRRLHQLLDGHHHAVRAGPHALHGR